MKQRLGIVIALFCLSPAIFAQQKAEKNAREDNASFTFTESQLNEDDDAAQSASAFVSSNNDVYLSNVGYLFSPMRFRVRGYNSQYSDTYINGVLFNDVETGRFSYGMIGGLNDATRNKEGIGAFEVNNFTFGPIGGATNINMRASQYAAGSKLSLSGCNRNYILRGMYTYSTGLLKNGWAFTGSLGYRWANEGVIEGTFYNAFSYFLAAEKVFNDKHSLSLQHGELLQKEDSKVLLLKRLIIWLIVTITIRTGVIRMEKSVTHVLYVLLNLLLLHPGTLISIRK